MSCTKSIFRNMLSFGIVGLCCAAQSAPAAVVAFWEFEPGNLTADSSGNAQTLSNSSVTSSVDVPGTSSSGSAAFNGTSAFLSRAGLDLSAANQLTIEFFYKPTGNFASDADILFEHSSNFNTGSGGIVTFGSSSGSVNQFNVGYKPSGYLTDTVNPASVTGWHHFAVEYDRTAVANGDVIKAYVDYNLVGVDTLSSSGRTAFFNATFFLGARNGTSLFYDGLIDQFRISNTLLGPSQFLQADAPVLPVPEPSSLVLLLFGSLILKRVSRRMR